MASIEFYQENTTNIELEFDFDLSGATIYFTVKSGFDSDQTDGAALIKKDVVDHVDAVNGKTIIPLTVADTSVAAGEYGFDIKVKKGNGEQITAVIGDCTIKEAYTLRG